MDQLNACTTNAQSDSIMIEFQSRQELLDGKAAKAAVK